MNIENIENLEREITDFIKLKNSHGIDDDWFYRHFRIESYSNDYNLLSELTENNTKKRHCINNLDSKINNLKNKENNFIKLTNQLNPKFNQQKINKKINVLLKIITFGIFDLNKKINKKIQILEKIKELKQQNLVKINELKFRHDKKIINSINIKNFQSFIGVPSL